MVDNVADDDFEYNEDRDYLEINHQNVQIIPNQQVKPQTANAKSKPKKIIVVNERKHEPEYEEFKRVEDYPQLAGTRPQTAAT